jgi:hypothetical protein
MVRVMSNKRVINRLSVWQSKRRVYNKASRRRNLTKKRSADE